MNAYDTAPWQNFFIAEVGAAAALTGLLFVAVSINLKQILSFPKLPARAAETLSLLLLVVAVSSLALAPQTSEALGIEVIGCAGLMSLAVLRVQLRHGPDDPADPAWWFASRIANVQLPALLFLAGGITLTVRHGYGLYFMLAGTLTAFLGAVYNAWVLLVEIIRQHPDPPGAAVINGVVRRCAQPAGGDPKLTKTARAPVKAAATRSASMAGVNWAR